MRDLKFKNKENYSFSLNFRDLKDMASKPLPDNQKEDSYVYEILGKTSVNTKQGAKSFLTFISKLINILIN